MQGMKGENMIVANIPGAGYQQLAILFIVPTYSRQIPSLQLVLHHSWASLNQSLTVLNVNR
jgi:hypothetical protein